MDNRILSESSLTRSVQDTSYIFFHKEFILCLVCQRSISYEISVSSHILGFEHKINLFNLFKRCMQEPFCNSDDRMFADIFKNSVLDISYTCKNDISNIYQIYTNFSCLICPKSVFSTGDADIVEENLVSQLKVKRDLHFDCMKSNYSWIYSRSKTNTFMMFHNVITYCALCKLVIHHKNCHELSVTDKHLESSQHKRNLKSSLLPIKVPENLPPTAAYVPVTMDALEKEFSLLDLEACGTDISHIDFPNDEVSDTLYSEIDYSSSDEMLQDSLACPECGEVVEILNDNADFSLRHHIQKHIALTDVNKANDCMHQEDTDYVCPVCSETIPIFNKNLELSISCHFNEKNHDREFISKEMCNESGFLEVALSDLPQEHQTHRYFFTLDGNNIFCKLCSCVLEDPSCNMNSPSELLIRHILDRYHTDQYKVSSQKLALTVVNYNKDVSIEGSLTNTALLFEELVNKSALIRNNKDLIEVKKYLYLCKSCKTHINYSPKEKVLEKNFFEHFNLRSHKNNLKKGRSGIRLPASAIDQTKNESAEKKIPNIDQNKEMFQEVLLRLTKSSHLSDVKYIDYKSGLFFCHICKVNISASMCGSSVKSHMLGQKHKTTVNKMNLSRAVKYSNIIKENLGNVDVLYEHFFCNVCKVYLVANSTFSHLKAHLAHKTHRKAVAINSNKH